MTATTTRHHPKPPGPSAANAKAPPGGSHPPESPPSGESQSSPSWDDMIRQTSVLRLVEHLNVGVQLVSDLGKDPAFSADDRLQAVFAAARVINANAHLGRAIGYLAQVEHRRRTVVQHIDPPRSWNDSNSNPEVLLQRDLTRKMLRYMNVIAGETFDPALQEAAGKAAHENAPPAQPEAARTDDLT